MEEVEQAEHILGGIWRYVCTNLSIHQSDTSAQQSLTFSNGEEQALGAKMSEAINAYRRALTNAHDWIGDMQDSKEAQLVAQELEKHNAQIHSHMTNCRKVLVAYLQRAQNQAP
ncbi:uncharacterized protein PHALS_09058 [Plasmopara halstedii]|uniref:Uncharacterized protein n=1 Tax=Plasmopara halstedii TaxID=4781 RepID=A0A0P1ADE0_PLAHL|nr:uncharacterized protein PHALS_09058 [Plasmopara halstedii]CEG38993.1 hypothetical protein PHALS_09058 [Plasmopara halstedii]|eukprot:XP_024575362.1 hypothetical protein PHALS_09058 [Plasmopara halstedii]